MVVSLPRNDKLLGCMRRFIRLNIIKTKRTLLTPLSLWARRGGTKCRKNSPQVTVFSQSGEVAMLRAGRWQRRGNLPEGKTYLRTRTKYSPAVAHRRAKRTEWRMRGIKPNNKIIVVFPSSVLPSLRFGNPPSPEGEGLIGGIFYPPVSRFYLTDRKNGGIIRI